MPAGQHIPPRPRALRLALLALLGTPEVQAGPGSIGGFWQEDMVRDAGEQKGTPHWSQPPPPPCSSTGPSTPSRGAARHETQIAAESAGSHNMALSLAVEEAREVPL